MAFNQTNKPTTPCVCTYRTATTEEQVATVKLQKQWKGYWVRKIRAARQPGSEENAKVASNLQKCWALIEQAMDPASPEHPGLFLFRLARTGVSLRL